MRILVQVLILFVGALCVELFSFFENHTFDFGQGALRGDPVRRCPNFPFHLLVSCEEIRKLGHHSVGSKGVNSIISKVARKSHFKIFLLVIC